MASLSILVGLDQDDPFQLRALLISSTAMQKLVVGQDTELNKPWGSALVGLDQDDPFQLSALPLQSTAMQNVELLQEMDLMLAFGSTVVAVDQACPGAGTAAA